ncbi:hypothetical protein GCM10010510_48510 [Streptomyces anandii JCM 4720]|nr:hypothetical protein GCM10010510_48510 [Streptomyces anandii JCM 4720]
MSATDQARDEGVTRRERLQYVHGDHVGEVGHGDVRQFLRGALQVEGGADLHARLVDQGEAAADGLGLELGALLVGDVDEGGGQTDGPAVGVLQPDVGARPHAVVGGVGGGAADAPEVEHGLPGGEHPAHRRLHVGRVHAGQEFHQAVPDVRGLGQPVHGLQGGVDAQEAQVGVQDGDADG